MGMGSKVLKPGPHHNRRKNKGRKLYTLMFTVSMTYTSNVNLTHIKVKSGKFYLQYRLISVIW